jgi:hypothetical protein
MNPIHEIVREIEKRRTALAVASVERPSSDHLITGVTAGKYQGLGEALNIIQSVMDDEHQKQDN